jgi:hypothetical protein
VEEMTLKIQFLFLIVCVCAATVFAADLQPASIENIQRS